ncbi:MAG: translation initiation factor IF-2, partial [Mesorhizobium sp.]|nr:translation initiation factor IF-2 [Mesorhizobium sp.]
MSDTKSGDDKTLSVTPKKTLTLKRPGLEQGTVRQNFSHGRTKSVVVETKKRKFSLPGDKPEPVAAASVFTPKPAPAPVAAAPVVREAPKAPPPPPERSGMVLNELSRGEMEARRKALEGSKAREAEDRLRAQEDAKRRAEEEERRKRERDESARRQAEEEARLQAEAESRRRAEEEARRRAPQAADVATADDEEEAKPRRTGSGAGASAPPRRLATPEVARPAKPTKGEEDRRRGKLTLNSALSDDDARGRSLSSMRRRQEKFKRALHNEPREKVMREVILPETITIQELAQRMS